MTETEVLKAIVNHLRAFSMAGFSQDQQLQLPNEESVFTAPKDKLWCRASIQYADSRIVAIGNKPCKRNYGILSIQCFAPIGSGILDIAMFCDAWTSHLEFWQSGHLEINIVHAPQHIDDDNFYGKILRAEFQVN